MKHARTTVRARQRGLTLVELLVALTIGLLVAIAALTTLVIGRTGFTTVDNTSQLVDRERFAIDIVSRLVSQAGFEDYGAALFASRAVHAVRGYDPEPDVFGWNDAFYEPLDDLAITTATRIADGNRNSKCGTVADTSCRNGSDILLVRFQGSGPLATPDGSIVNCRGEAEPGLTADDLNQRAANVLYVGREAATGEPSLYCAYYKHATAAWVSGQPLIEGVESMQVLYGTDGVTPNVAPPLYGVGTDTVVDRWLRADQLKVPGNAPATRENWRRVRAVRVGLVLRGPPGSAQEAIASSVSPLGPTYVAGADSGSTLALPADSRLRRVSTFTVHIRNNLSTR